MHRTMIAIGNYFFRTRNYAFPLIMLALFAIAVPPSEVFASVQLEHIKDIAAVLIAFAGLAMRALVIGFVYIKRGGLNKQVYAESLVTSGIFALSRNPLYVGNILIYAGVFLMHGNLYVMAVGGIAFLFIYHCIVAAEEAYLQDKFGDAYRAYCADVPRWWPRFSKFREATEGMRFDAKKALLKDYSTITTTLVTLALIEGYEYLAIYARSPHLTYLIVLSAITVVCVLFALSVRMYKKSGSRVA